jgi:5-enolpyruvylshikimate-3-phosphate synthase
VIAALCADEPQVMRPALCDDTAVMIEALSHDGGEINVGASGTAMRFLTAYFATREGTTVTLDGVERMHQSPSVPLSMRCANWVPISITWGRKAIPRCKSQEPRYTARTLLWMAV